jgi:hypothetical protein
MSFSLAHRLGYPSLSSIDLASFNQLLNDGRIVGVGDGLIVGVGVIVSKFADLSKVGGVKETISVSKKETEDAEMSTIEKEMSAKLFNNLTFSILCHSPPSRLSLLVYTEHLILIY